MSRAYPNVINFEGIHGLENTKWGAKDLTGMMDSDVRAVYLRMTAGPMDYTPGAMDNYPVDGYLGGREGPKDAQPGSAGTRCRQMAMMALYEAPLQMLCDAPTKYEANLECFKFMAATPVVWADSRGLAGDPDSFAAVARRAKDGAWYAAAISNRDAREFKLDTAAFLDGGEWEAEIFRDAPEGDAAPTKYVHETRSVKAGDQLDIGLGRGGGFVARFVRK
jgi:alpha-glucosidase